MIPKEIKTPTVSLTKMYTEYKKYLAKYKKEKTLKMKFVTLMQIRHLQIEI